MVAVSTHLSILRKGFIVSVQDVSTALDDVDRDLVSQDLGKGVEQVLVEQIKQLSCEFNTGWTAATNDERK